jgi:uncharacterized membrane protein
MAREDILKSAEAPAPWKGRVAAESREWRIASVDILRGLIMAIMALDHTRDFLTSTGFNPRDVMQPALFLTRWVTKICAPTFILLAGLSAFLYGRGKDTEGLSRFLLIRGLWLILIDFTLIKFGWRFELDLFRMTGGIIFAIGVSMIALAALVWLPRWVIAIVTAIMLALASLLSSKPALLELASIGRYVGNAPLLTRHGALLVSVGLNQACIHCKALATHQTLSHAPAHHHLKQMSQDVALAEPTVTVPRESGVIGNLTIKS